MTRVPKVFDVVQATLSFNAVMNVSIPGGAASFEQAGCGDTISAFKDKASSGQLDPRRTAGETLAMYVAPRAEGVQLEANRTGRSHHSMRDRYRGASTVHHDLSLDGHVADGPPPPRHAMLEHEGLEVDIARWIDSTRGPLVHTEPDPAVSDDDAGVKGSQAEHPAARWLCSDDKQTVIAPGPQPANRSHRIAAQAIGDQPLALGGGLEVAANLTAESHDVSVGLA
jgi:hypothetical protein